METSGARKTIGAAALLTAVLAASLVVLAGTAATSAAAPAETRQVHDTVQPSRDRSSDQCLHRVVHQESRPPLEAVAAEKDRHEIRKGSNPARVGEMEGVSGNGLQPPFPSSFCSTRLERWGLGQALWYRGQVPGVWNRTYSRQYQTSQPLTPRYMYWLTCWRYGDRVYGPYKSTTIWYRAAYRGGYVSGALLYTGSWNQIPGMPYC